MEGGIWMGKFLFTGDTGVKLVENDGCSVYQLRNETGKGTVVMIAHTLPIIRPVMILGVS